MTYIKRKKCYQHLKNILFFWYTFLRKRTCEEDVFSCLSFPAAAWFPAPSPLSTHRRLMYVTFRPGIFGFQQRVLKRALKALLGVKSAFSLPTHIFLLNLTLITEKCMLATRKNEPFSNRQTRHLSRSASAALKFELSSSGRSGCPWRKIHAASTGHNCTTKKH